MTRRHPDIELPDGLWWACDHPERPPDSDTAYGWSTDCDGCFIAAQAAAAQAPSAFVVDRRPDVQDRTREPLGDMVAEWAAARAEKATP